MANMTTQEILQGIKDWTTGKLNSNDAKNGYYVCSTDANVAAKTISATNYVLGNGGSIKVKMTNANTAGNATLNINSTGDKALYYDGERASANNSWEAGETVEVYYDGTSFYANNVAGGSGSGDGAFDVSAKYPTSGVDGGNTYTLEGALAVLNANLSARKKRGGMSIKFVRSSDNNYVQYRLMADEFTTDITQWSIDDGGVLIENSEFLYLRRNEQGGIIWAIKKDGTIYYGAGVPPQVIAYIEKRIADYNISQTYAFLNGLEFGSKTLQQLFDEKVDEEEGKSLADAYFAEKNYSIESPEWVEVFLDKEGGIIEGRKKDMTKYPSQAENTTSVTDEDGLPIVPDYYFENDYLDNKILAINNEIRKCAINGDAFFWITDIHWDHKNQRLSPSLIKYIRKRTEITRLLCGGDISDGYKGANMNYIWHDQNCMMDFINKCRSAISSNMVYATYGNHDLGEGTLTYDEVFYEYGFFRENVVYADSAKTAYYVDNAPQKMRYIALGEWGIHTTGYENLLTESVKTWFSNTALDVEAGWTIVIFIHGLFANVQGTENLMPYIDPNTETWAKNSGVIIEPIAGCTDIIDTIDNYKANGGQGDIACVLMGHWHADRIHIGRVIAPATVGVPYILTQSDQFHDSHVGGLSDIKAPRTAGTITEQHFEVVVVNKDDRTVKLFAIGSQARDGIDSNVGDLVDVRTVNY